MLTRLRVKGFKNLRDVDLSFGPFTCVAGPNGVGKSNLFDAITLLSDLASKPVLEALLAVRGTNGRVAEIGSLFSRTAAKGSLAIELIAEMVVPRTALDDYERETRPTATFVEYALELRFDPDRLGGVDKDPVYIEREELRAKSSSDAARSLPFNPGKKWISRYVAGPGARTAPFIRTDAAESGAEPIIKLLGDKSRGRPFGVPARKAPQTVLSGVNAASHPTALAVRNEMKSWQLLQLEPTALRRPDELHGLSQVSATGEHLPAALMRIGSHAEVARRLAELIPGVVSVDVESDKVRQTRTLVVTLKDRHFYSASSLSDGTLRFLALAVMASDPDASGLICMEEPENGIHPLRIPHMMRLVRSLADADDSDGELPDREALRQVLINTHSPLVVAQLRDDELLVAETLRLNGSEFINFKPLVGTWRAPSGQVRQGDFVSRGDLEAYLGHAAPPRPRPDGKSRRVVDHFTPDLFAKG